MVLGMKSMAPASMALSVASAPNSVSELIMMTGRGLLLMSCLSVSSPSIRGISRSSVMTSG